MQAFKTKGFARFARQEEISDRSLAEAIERAERGIVDADLGYGLIKQRVARPGQGRSGGYRTIVAYMVNKRAVFIHGFAKSHRENITQDQLQALRKVAANWLALESPKMQEAIQDGALQEIDCER